ncbi:MAG: DUF58 domain-containing protein [Clostridia bacterium]|nr:DUF58 domain-containing protein [Clostridia bacterium]
MTRSRLIYLALLVTAFIFSQALYDSISLFTLAVVLLIPLISLLCLLISLALVKVELDPVPARERRLHEFSIRLNIKSHTPVMLPMMKFFLRVNNQAGDEAVPGYAIVHYRAFGLTHLDIPLEFRVRGLYKVGVDSVVFYDFLRLFSIKKRLSRGNVVVIAPRDLQLELPVHSSRQEQENTVSVGGHETKYNGDMAGIREFNEYDTLRQVHWKLSARLSKMIVKTYWENSCDNIMILADLFPYEEDQLTNRRLTDCVVEIALQLTDMLAQQGIRSTLAYPNYESMLHLQSITTPEEQVVAADGFAMTPMMEVGHLEESLSELDFSSLQGGALYLVSSMPPEGLMECLEPYLRGINCELQYLVVRPDLEPERGVNMKVLTLAEMEDE